jgi:hypothetical protein
VDKIYSFLDMKVACGVRLQETEVWLLIMDFDIIVCHFIALRIVVHLWLRNMK